MYIKIAFLILAVVRVSTAASPILCFSCSNVTDIPECSTVVTCPADSICSSEYTTTPQGGRLYTLGCKSISSCPVHPTVNVGGIATIEGRRATANRTCSDCCTTNHCNRKLCQNQDPHCEDNHDFNCETITGAGFNLCNDESHAKLNCRRWCGFCNTVDGGWSAWSEWSSCDVTCANGTRTRTRSCNDPAPANGGSDCAGETTVHDTCSKVLCPVHGSWSRWSDWGSCTVTCDIGLQRRDRTCSNPYPGPSGDHCYGDSRDDRVCSPGPCANGSWSSWSTWGSCDKTCDGGIRSRIRNCDNPPPSLTGKYCLGETTEAEQCNLLACQDGSWSSWSTWGSCDKTCDGGIRSRIRNCDSPPPSLTGMYCLGQTTEAQQCNLLACQDGGWSSWGTWSSCDKTCDGGVRTRTRNCASPAPSLTGKYCPGSPYLAESCNVLSCQGPVIFRAKDLHSTSPGANTNLRFMHVTTNVGNAYSSSTGIFTAPVAGTYTFSVQFCTTTTSGNHGVVLYINGVKYQHMSSYSYSGIMCRTLTAHALLKLGDRVNVKSDEHSSGTAFYTNSYIINIFSGALVRL